MSLGYALTSSHKQDVLHLVVCGLVDSRAVMTSSCHLAPLRIWPSASHRQIASPQQPRILVAIVFSELAEEHKLWSRRSPLSDSNDARRIFGNLDLDLSAIVQSRKAYSQQNWFSIGKDASLSYCQLLRCKTSLKRIFVCSVNSAVMAALSNVAMYAVKHLRVQPCCSCQACC